MADSSAASDDLACITRMAQGDETALYDICARYRMRLWTYLWRQLAGDSGRAEEALQDTLLGIWRGAGQFRGTAPVAVWIFRIAHHVAAKARRDHQRHTNGQWLSLDDDDDSLAHTTAPNLETQVVERLTLDAALAQLAPKHREVLELVGVYGFAPDEVAHILDVPAGTVRSRLSYARQALAKAMHAASVEGVTYDR